MQTVVSTHFCSCRPARRGQAEDGLLSIDVWQCQRKKKFQWANVCAAPAPAREKRKRQSMEVLYDAAGQSRGGKNVLTS